MAPARHKLEQQSVPLVRRVLNSRAFKIGVPVAGTLVVGSSAVALGLPSMQPPAQSISAAAEPDREPLVVPSPVSVREAPLSRSADRVELEAVPEPVDHEFTTTKLNVWTEPTEDSELLDVLPWAAKVWVTGVEKGQGAAEWAEIVVDERSYWVHAAYLDEQKPQPEPEPEPEPTQEEAPSAPPGLSTAPCPGTSGGSAVENGLVSNAIAVHRAVCAAFPEVTTYGGLRPGDDGEHGTGQALDIMIPDSATGDEIAEFARANAGELGVSEVIWSQQIWTVQRSSEGWRWMEDMGSPTANHYDHVHVTVY